MRRSAFRQPVIIPPKVKRINYDLQDCPECGFRMLIEIKDEGMESVSGLYCSGCDTQFIFNQRK